MFKSCLKVIVISSLLASLSGCIVYSADRDPNCPCYQQNYVNGTRPIDKLSVCPYHRRPFDGCRYCEHERKGK